jgi:hypothetical protein
MRINAWVSLDFLQEITTKTFDLTDTTKLINSKTHLNLLDLVLNGLNVKVDSDNNTIRENINNPYIINLIKNNRIESRKDDFIKLRSNPDNYFSEAVKEIAIYFLNSVPPDYQNKSGYFFLTPKDDLSILFNEEFETFEKSSSKDWEFTKRYFEPHHSIVIADPYIFKSSSFEAIITLMFKIIPKQLKSTYHITFLGSDENRKNDLPSFIQIKSQIEKLSGKLSKSLQRIIVEFHVYNREEFHDRYVITNNVCIFSGHGFGMSKEENTAKLLKETLWIAYKPFKRVNENGLKNSFFYKVMLDRLKLINMWIKESSNNKTNNPLFTFT